MDDSGEGCGCLLLIAAVIGFFSIIVYDASQSQPSIPIEPLKVEIQRVAEHEVGSYSVDFFIEPNKENITVNLGRDAKIIYDVSENEPIWAMLNRAQNKRGETRYISGEIHIHSGKDISGGGWNHGKNGSGQTSTVDAQ